MNDQNEEWALVNKFGIAKAILIMEDYCTIYINKCREDINTGYDTQDVELILLFSLNRLFDFIEFEIMKDNKNNKYDELIRTMNSIKLGGTLVWKQLVYVYDMLREYLHEKGYHESTLKQERNILVEE